MRRRLGGVHCQTYEELAEILDAKHAPCSSTLDIEALLLDQQRHKTTPPQQPDYFFDEKHQIQAEEQQLLLTVEAEAQAVSSYSLVLICQELPRLRDTLLDKKFVEKLYAQIYEQEAGKWKVEAEIACNMASVTLRGQNQRRESWQESQVPLESSEQGLYSGQSAELDAAAAAYRGCILQPLQLVIYYNKIGHQIKKGPQLPITRQIRIWLMRQQPHYGPLLAVYLTTARSIFVARFAKQMKGELELHEMGLQETRWRVGERREGDVRCGEQRGERKGLREALRQLETGVCRTSRAKRQ